MTHLSLLARARLVAVVTAALATAGGLLVAAPAHAVTPVSVAYVDATDTGAAYDIGSITVRSAPSAGGWARVVLRHGRPVRVGDAVDVWLNVDADARPDLHVVAYSFSEFQVFRARSFSRDGADITARDCARVSMAGRRTVVRFHPGCLGTSRRSAAVARSFGDGATGSPDWAPARRTFTQRVWSYRRAG